MLLIDDCVISDSWNAPLVDTDVTAGAVKTAGVPLGARNSVAFTLLTGMPLVIVALLAVVRESEREMLSTGDPPKVTAALVMDPNAADFTVPPMVSVPVKRTCLNESAFSGPSVVSPPTS